MMEQKLIDLGYGYFCEHNNAEDVTDDDAYDFLPTGTILQKGDEYWDKDFWDETCCIDDEIENDWSPYRRLKPGFEKIEVKE